MFIYRKFSQVSQSWDVGCYYTFNDLILLGVLARFGGRNSFSTVQDNGVDIVNVTGGFKLMKKLLVGYSLDISSTNTAPLGPSHEFTLSYKFLGVKQKQQQINDRSPSKYKGGLKGIKRK